MIILNNISISNSSREENILRYKKIMILTIILTFLLAVSTVSAAENITEDIVGIDATVDVVNNDD